MCKFLQCACSVAEKLRNLFLLFAGHLLKNVSALLDSNNGEKQGTQRHIDPYSYLLPHSKHFRRGCYTCTHFTCVVGSFHPGRTPVEGTDLVCSESRISIELNVFTGKFHESAKKLIFTVQAALYVYVCTCIYFAGFIITSCADLQNFAPSSPCKHVPYVEMLKTCTPCMSICLILLVVSLNRYGREEGQL